MFTEAALNARQAERLAKMDWVNAKAEVFTCKNGTRYFMVNNVIHREDGPAIIWSTGKEVWMYRGVEITPEAMPPKMLAAYRQWSEK